MNRDALKWIAVGAGLASSSWILSNALSESKKESALVLWDDMPDALYETRQVEAEDLLPRSAHQCKIAQFTYDAPIPDAHGELFVPIGRNSPDTINCMLDIAKEWQLTVRFTNDFEASMTEKTIRTEKK
ncbi:MAG: hypothetical protein JNN10_09915 [Sphingopyxis sp.]|uniref:hypothetical protein n=1 Tax=Sphingopyxis sp. TaxID=1908224 RepID=UPI001A441119|nr:hypothetical protein [Sphingopyxis sp.]MBL9066594.1 hypothetical protein [Sphingopyxis sp.]